MTDAADTPSASRAEPAARSLDPRALWLVLGLALLALPVFSAHYVPATDLPQHLAQVRLLDEWLGLAPRSVDLSALTLQPFAAHTLPYWPMWLVSRVGSAALAGRLFAFGMLAACAAALHYLARSRGRHPTTALAASVFLFSTPLYWGFVNFVCGLPVFLLWTERMLRRDTALGSARRDWFTLAGLGLCMYGTHVFWLAAACLLAPLAIVVERRAVRDAARRLTALLPALLATALWYPTLASARAQTPVEMGAEYVASFGERVSWDWLVMNALGGLKGPWEHIAVAALLAAGVAACVLGRRRGLAIDRTLATLGAALVVFAWLAPDKYMNTILVNTRFLPVGAALLCLALPFGATRSLAAFVTVIATGFSLITAVVWVVFNEDELQGLDAALASVEGPRSVLSVDLRQKSALIYDRPFLQTFAYFQAEHGGELSFSFTEHASSLIRNTRPRLITWTHGIEWYPERLRAQDLAAFQCALVNGSDADHAAFATRFGLGSAGEGPLRLYCH